MNFNINLDELESVAYDYMQYRNEFFRERAKQYRKDQTCYIDPHRRSNDGIYKAYDLMELYDKALHTACYVLGIQFDSVIAAQRAINKYYNGMRNGYVSMNEMQGMIKPLL